MMIKLNLVAGYRKPFPTPPHGPWKYCLPPNWSMVPKRLRTAAPELLACPVVRLRVLLLWSKAADREFQVFAKAGSPGCRGNWGGLPRALGTQLSLGTHECRCPVNQCPLTAMRHHYLDSVSEEPRSSPRVTRLALWGLPNTAHGGYWPLVNEYTFEQLHK